MTFLDDRNIPYLDCGRLLDFIHLSKFIELYTLKGSIYCMKIILQFLKIHKGISFCNAKMPDPYIGSLTSSTRSARVGKAWWKLLKLPPLSLPPAAKRVNQKLYCFPG